LKTATSPFDRLVLAPEVPLTFAELKMWALLKRRLKHGPKMTRKQRAEYLRRLARRLANE